STFLQRSYDQLIHDVCTQKLPMLFAIDRAGIVGDDGKTHQGLFDLSFLRCVPDLVVAAPSNENELQHLIHTGIRQIAGGGLPFAIRYPRGAGTGVAMDEDLKTLPIGKGELLRDGSDLAIIGIGSAVKQAKEAAEILAGKGISVALVDARYLKPLDTKLILDVCRRCRRVVTVEENVLAGGFGSGVLELLASSDLTGVEVETVGIPDEFMEHGTPALLREKYGLTGAAIASRAVAAFALHPAVAPALAS
ncbi:MAG TPA: transketolase C-terminal domain-containing protein, partial [Chloroflexota bacterium]